MDTSTILQIMTESSTLNENEKFNINFQTYIKLKVTLYFLKECVLFLIFLLNSQSMMHNYETKFTISARVTG